MSGEDDGGTVGDGRFACRERVDSGGLGTVWRGVDRERGGPVAIKRDHAAVNEAASVRAGFRKELRWFRRLAAGPTPGSLVHFRDGAVGEDGAYVVTELLAGGSIEDHFAGERTPGEGPLLEVVPRIARAVDFLHRNGVLHRDVKPGNVLLRRRPDGDRVRTEPVLIDLNSAVPVDAGGSSLFHPDPFKPPELLPTELREAAVGPPADVYALGTLGAFLLTGEARTVEAESLADWAPVDPRERGAAVDADLAAVVERATAPRPGDRYEDAGAFYDALAAAAGLPERAAVLVDPAADQRIRVRPGDAIGRWTPDQRVPQVVLPDEEELLSAVHASIEWDGSGWVLVDRSLNGTYVERADGPRAYALSAEGRERRVERDAALPVEDPSPTVRLEPGDRIAPVAADVGSVLRFEPE